MSWADLSAANLGIALTIRWNIYGWPCALVILGCVFINRVIVNAITRRA